MKNFTVYLNTTSGRSQVTLEAETAEVKEATFEFSVEEQIVAVFARDKAFGFVEERPRTEWQEEPPGKEG